MLVGTANIIFGLQDPVIYLDLTIRIRGDFCIFLNVFYCPEKKFEKRKIDNFYHF